MPMVIVMARATGGWISRREKPKFTIEAPTPVASGVQISIRPLMMSGAMALEPRAADNPTNSPTLEGLPCL